MPEPLTTAERLAALLQLAETGIPAGAVLRQGGKEHNNLYLVTPEYPGGLAVGRMDTAELAAAVVEAMNGAEDLRRVLDHMAEPRDTAVRERDVAWAELARLRGERA